MNTPLVRVAPDERFGRVVVLREDLPRVDCSGRAKRVMRVICDCGTEASIRLDSLRTGVSQSCGCLHAETAAKRGREKKTHGMSGTAVYQSWLSMRERCYDPKNKRFESYGGRGINVCAQWNFSFEAFFADMGSKPLNKTLDRIDNDKGYSANNCRWATPKEQANNRRPRRTKAELFAQCQT